MRTSLFVVLAAIVPTIASCSLLKRPGADGGDAEPTASAAVSATATPSASAPASNASSIARYPDEKPNRRDATINFTTAGVTDGAVGGAKAFAFLKKGTAVTQLAERGKFALVTFKDPKDPSRQLMGWVSSDVFGAEPAKRTPPRLGGCKPDEQVVQVMRTDGTGQFEDRCQHVCKTDKDCGAGTVCEGGGLDANGGSDISFCVKGTASAAASADPKCKPGEHLILHNSAPTCFVPCKNDGDCKGGTACSGEGMDVEKATFGNSLKYCEHGETPPRASATPTATPAGPKPKCVLPSAPPCKSPHAESPKGLCQIPCPSGDCSACDGQCQKGFCVAK